MAAAERTRALPAGPGGAESGGAARLRLLVLDLDGTLVDTLPAIAEAVNVVRRRHGAPELPSDAVRDAIGEGSRVLAGRVFADLAPADADPRAAEAVIDGIHREFIADYARSTDREGAPWRRGALGLLERARALGLELALLSNKPLALAERVLELGGVRGLFAAVRGPENSPAAKPDPRALLDLLGERGARPEESCFVGDSVVDFATGRAAGVLTIGVRGGYRPDGDAAPDIWCEDPAEVERWLAARVRRAG